MIDSTEDLEIVYFNKPTYTFMVPDGGYGWWVVFAAFMNSALIDGMFYSFGMVRLMLEEYLPPVESASFAVNLVGALQISFPLLSGPLGSILGKKFGFRLIAMVGGTISSISFLICFFAPPNLAIFYIFFGVFAGMGLGLVYMAGIITISQYFDKKRPLSTGIAVCGTGFGVFVLGSLLPFLIQMYAFHGSLFILAAIAFQTILFSSLLKSLNTDGDATDNSEHKSQLIKSDINKITGSTIFSKEAINTVVKSGFISSFIDLSSMMEGMGIPQVENQDIMYIRSITNITVVPVKRKTSDDEKSVIKRHCDVWKYFFYRPVCFRNVQLFLYYLSALLFSLCFTLPFYYVGSRVTQMFNFSSAQAGFILSGMGLSSLLCRFATGVASTLIPNYKLWIYVTCLVICGIMQWVSNFIASSILWILWGVCVGGSLGSIVTLESVILAELVKIDEMASAFGTYQLTCGLGTLFGPPIAGLLFDSFESYDIIFSIAGVIFTLSGLIVIPIHWLVRS